jgi:hypothetical protein
MDSSQILRKRTENGSLGLWSSVMCDGLRISGAVTLSRQQIHGNHFREARRKREVGQLAIDLYNCRSCLCAFLFGAQFQKFRSSLLR